MSQYGRLPIATAGLASIIAVGTIGYILQGDVGFRVETEKGKRYVVTIPEPEGLVEYVKAAKAEGPEQDH